MDEQRSYTKHIAVPAILFLMSFAVAADERHTQFDTLHGGHDDADMEHLIVTGEAEDTLESERRAYLDHRRGMLHYSRGNYSEALPYLISSAKHGFKDSQARLAHLYLHGLGGVRRSDVVGIAWMGVAAHGETTPNHSASVR